MLKRILLLVVVLVLVPGSALAQSVEVQSPSVQGFAGWQVPRTDDKVWVYWVYAARFVDDEGPQTYVLARKVSCRHKGWFSILFVCLDSGGLWQPKPIRDASFSFDPLLESATVSFELAGERSEVTWMAEDVPRVDGTYFGAEGFHGWYANYARDVAAQGVLLGRGFELGSPIKHHAWLNLTTGGSIYETKRTGR